MANTHVIMKAIPRPIYIIAQDIRRTWKSVWYGAEPYLQAMSQLNLITDKYGDENAQGIIIYFLSNATYWRGEEARRIKKELSDLIET